MLDVIKDRASLRAYRPDPVPSSVITELLEAMGWAPSARNRQPWQALVVQQPEALARLHQTLAAGNEWAVKAPLAIVVLANPADDAIVDGKPYYLFDCGLAVQNLLLQATAAHLCSHPTLGWDEQAIKTAFAIDDALRVLCVVFLGYPGSSDSLDEATRAKDALPRQRKPLESWVRYL
ncbi:nitroreductase family protein [Heliophilum fasciatum]|uniref:Nitroreductase n=1 Tax=Heliophilum fasciatum TaxID=35700 RepID=A0A4R2RNS6_9FIRM|nr:nitroreductase family protein [Heliophilum fasciatum]MCW2278031.1 nitroreductase [Heliophilum fasciatum]TCP64349.1 nitroreductase [Heliophilum fasciatum]